MNIHEYQAKNFFSDYGIKIQKGKAILNESEIDDVIQSLEFDSNKYVVKAQIYAGSRGKGGGIKVATNKKQAAEFAKDMYGKTLITPQTTKKGLKVSRIYIEEGLYIEKPYYLSLITDNKSGTFLFIGSSSGGVDIEEVATTNPREIKQLPVCPFSGLNNFTIVKFANSLGITTTKSIRSFTNVIKALFKIFLDYDATQIEINPLCLTSEEDFIALDAKIDFDDNALFRHEKLKDLIDEDQHEKLELRATKSGLSYIKLDGNIGCMVNGAGLAMATMDIIKLYGAAPANFLDVGGGADVNKVTEAFKIIAEDKSVKAILVNIFGGIMKCDIIAQGILTAIKESAINVPLVVRLEGTNVDLGKKLLNESNIKLKVVDNLSDAAVQVVQESKK